MNEADKDRFTTLLKPCLDSLYRVARRMTPSPEEAEDLVASACLRAWEKFNTLKNANSFKPWIFRMLHTIYIDLYRQKKARPSLSLDEATDEEGEFSLFDELSSPFILFDTNPEKKFLEKLMREDIDRALASLSETYRLVASLCCFEGFAYQETARILNLPIGTVRSRLNRGKSILQKRLYEYAVERGYIKRSDGRSL